FVGDVSAGVRRVAAALRPGVNRTRRTAPFATTPSSAAELAPGRVVELVAGAFPDARVTVDAGAHMFPATGLWPVGEPTGLLISNGLSTMGFALPAAIGAAMVDQREGRGGQVVALTGDGGLLMCAGELLTAAREQHVASTEDELRGALAAVRGAHGPSLIEAIVDRRGYDTMFKALRG
ncbi:MAG: hypothetical protein JF610_13785, partial [Acidobacteria bacterium]|nr:hypothetical protein [Acidobacteriota bacterium]